MALPDLSPKMHKGRWFTLQPLMSHRIRRLHRQSLQNSMHTLGSTHHVPSTGNANSPDGEKDANEMIPAINMNLRPTEGFLGLGPQRAAMTQRSSEGEGFQ